MSVAYTYDDLFVARLLEKVDQYEDMEKCWIINCKGLYPYIWYKDKIYKAFAIFHEYLFGPIPTGTERHHKCEVTRCINPNHVEVLSISAHRAMHARREHCPQGHPYNEENTLIYVRKDGYTSRMCRICKNEHLKRYYRRNRLL